jgi:predicted transport protein
MLAIKKLGRELADKISIDWENPRVICIAESYSKFDIDTVEVVPIRIELFRYRLYENGVFSLEPLNTPEKVIEKLDKAKLSRAITTESVPEGNSNIRQLFEELRSRIMQLDEEIIEKQNPQYTAYKLSKNFAEVHLSKQAIKIHLRTANYNDPQGLIKRVPESYKWTLDHILTLDNRDQLDYVMKLVELSYKDVI